MFTRVRTSLLLWNLLIISVILFAAGTITYLSQRQSLLAGVDRALTQAANTQPGLARADGNAGTLLDRQVPLTLVVDANGEVLADPESLGVKQIALLTPPRDLDGRFRFDVRWFPTLQAQPVQRLQKLVYVQAAPPRGVEDRLFFVATTLQQDSDNVQGITTGTIEGQPVRFLVRPVVFTAAASTAVNTTGTTEPPATIAEAAKPNAYLVTGLSLVPVEQSLHQTMVVLLIGAAAGVVLSLLGSWLMAGKALVPIEQAYRRQQEFVADAAHELRTPLTILQTSTHLLNQHRLEPLEAQGRVFDDLREEIGRLTRLTCDLLDLARSDLGQLNLALGRVDLEQLGQTLVRRLHSLAAERQIDLQFVGAGRSSVVEADSDRLQQVFLILLDNAIKHTHPGGTVTIALAETGRSTIVEVRDTGEGIPPNVLGHVFDRFVRGDAARSRSTGGAGLGLAIARTLVEAHYGSLTLSSVVGRGTTATVRLPRTSAAPTPGRWFRASRLFPG